MGDTWDQELDPTKLELRCSELIRAAEIKAEVERLRSELAAAVAERDEARQLYAKMADERDVAMELEALLKAWAAGHRDSDINKYMESAGYQFEQMYRESLEATCSREVG